MKNKKIKYVAFQSAIMAPGVVGADATLSADKYPGIQMHLEPGMLVVQYNGGEVLIPTMNIRSMVVEDEVK